MFKVNLEVKINIGEEFKAYKNLSFLDPENTEEASYEDTCFDTFDKNLSNLNKELIIREEYNNGNKTTLLYGHQKSHASDEFYPEY